VDDFDLQTGAWQNKSVCVCLEGFSLEAALECSGYQSRALGVDERKHLYAAFVAEARSLAEGLASEQAAEEHQLDEGLEELKFFSVPERSITETVC
jgi:hypothetical protein